MSAVSGSGNPINPTSSPGGLPNASDTTGRYLKVNAEAIQKTEDATRGILGGDGGGGADLSRIPTSAGPLTRTDNSFFDDPIAPNEPYPSHDSIDDVIENG